MKWQKGKHRASKVAGRSVGWFVSLLALVVGVSVVVFPSAAKWATAIELAKDGQEYTLTTNEDSEQRFTEAVGANETGDYKGALTAVTVEGTNAIARLRIPSIGVDLPVYPDSTDGTLKKGAGHLEGSALPVGGLGTRSVITAHSGMPNRRMFDRLPKLDNGDLVYVTVLGQTLTYEVTGQRVDTPQDGAKHIQPQTGKDLLTLVTCTPYGINTHRLIITGQRVPDSHTAAAPAVVAAGFPWWAIAYTAGLAAVAAVGAAAKRQSQPAHNQRRKDKQKWKRNAPNSADATTSAPTR